MSDFLSEQEGSATRIGNTGKLSDAFRSEIRRVRQGYGANRPNSSVEQALPAMQALDRIERTLRQISVQNGDIGHWINVSSGL